MTDMTAIRIHHFGGPDALSQDHIERPEPGTREVLVRLMATSVNPVDYKIREGKFPPVGEDKLPYLLGRDLAGRVERVGVGVTRVREGDAVYAMPGFDRGTYAEYALVHESELSAAPTSIDLTDAGAVPLAALTAWQGVMEHGRLERGQRVLIHGGAGGVGHFAVQFARAVGATVFATASGKDRDFLIELGADTAIDYRAERFEDVATDIDLVFDLIGGETQDRSWSVLKPGGTIISTVQDPDEEKARAAGAMPGRRYMAQPSSDNLVEIAALIDAGQARVVISDRFALGDIAQAQSELGKGGVRGKILVTIPEGAVSQPR